MSITRQLGRFTPNVFPGTNNLRPDHFTSVRDAGIDPVTFVAVAFLLILVGGARVFDPILRKE